MMSSYISSSASSWLSSLLLPLPTLASESLDSSPCWSCWPCWPSSTIQYRSLFSPNHDCNCTALRISSSGTSFLSWAELACFLVASRLIDLYKHCRHANPATMGMMGCGADPSMGNGTLAESYANGNPCTYWRTCFRSSRGALCLSAKCRGIAVGCSAPLALIACYTDEHAILDVQRHQMAPSLRDGLGHAAYT